MTNDEQTEKLEALEKENAALKEAQATYETKLDAINGRIEALESAKPEASVFLDDTGADILPRLSELERRCGVA